MFQAFSILHYEIGQKYNSHYDAFHPSEYGQQKSQGWDIESGKSEKYKWPSDEVLKSHGLKDPQGRAVKHSKHVLALAVSSDGRYLATGGLDHKIDDGSIEQWSVLRKKPVHIIKNAHALQTLDRLEHTEDKRLSNGHKENGINENPCLSAHSWVGSVAVCRNSDLASSGAGNGSIRLWEIERESKGLRPLFELPLVASYYTRQPVMPFQNGWNSLSLLQNKQFLGSAFKTTTGSRTSEASRTKLLRWSFQDEGSAEPRVYEEGLKNVALSVVTGINTSIFAYGQTSSGKTYTMRGISESSMSDIFDYICEHDEREFVLKFSAMEIYNESVRDLLGLDSTPLRLLDDPERGTVVDKLTEVTLRDWSHLKQLLAVCEAERQIGETSLNATSSRSHQIIRMTVESYPRKFASADDLSTLAAFGIEKASKVVLSCHWSLEVPNIRHLVPNRDRQLHGAWPQNPGSATFPFSGVQVVLSCHWSLEVPNIRHLVPNRDMQLHGAWPQNPGSATFPFSGVQAAISYKCNKLKWTFKAETDACGISVAYLTATTSLSKVSVLHSDSGKKLNGEIRLTAQMNKSEPEEAI
ncbi:hypothetical protein POM88_053571 [Heracleum sosnowskyi]|uniref:Kinesin motor domain-containing protein n=1 Tax=Heracleum sosnowskyi TaxID=360622 RepID=A0AAD8LXK9_9APIA|nr:hypothetical protein POM88_053571 [Heracleum sosnowskyi]